MKLAPIPTLNIPFADDGANHLTTDDTATLQSALLIAAEKFEENAKAFRRYLPAPDEHAVMNIDRTTAMRLAEQFDKQANEARDLLDAIHQGNGLIILNVQPEEDDLAAAA
ncbi:hypothetical protein [Aureimonas frigidaquae]|uniref:hypothetical protein n=1 Tax=Aureimonas frigidaquae TaxID=424757 RepID=UPI000784DD22|nr:hypothetical protein [Aureimonas frigidaquae]